MWCLLAGGRQAHPRSRIIKTRQLSRLPMTRQQWKDRLEAIGFAAVIASLVFVGIETRNSTKQAALTAQALELSAYQQLMDNISRMNEATIGNSEVAAPARRDR
jgi:hypothetical protein